jgi:hypothetical protein
VAEEMLGIPMSHCALAVSRGPRFKYVQFATEGDLFPPLLFDLENDPQQVHDLLSIGGADDRETALRSAQGLVRWHMRSAERTLSGSFLHAERGLVESRDTWR